MYSASREFEERRVAPSYVLDAVFDVERYPEFVKGVSSVVVQNRTDRTLVAEFCAGMGGMDFTYTCFIERDENEVRWRRIAGAFRASEGAMTHLGEGRFRYTNSMDPGFAVPGFAVRFVLQRSVPRLVREFQAQALGRAQAAADA